MNKFETLKLSTRAQRVAQVTMSRQAVFNAFDEAMIGELDAAFTELEADPAGQREHTEVREVHAPAAGDGTPESSDGPAPPHTRH